MKEGDKEWAEMLEQGKETVKDTAEALAFTLRDKPEMRAQLLRSSPGLEDEDIEWLLSVARGEVPDDKICDKGLRIMERIRPPSTWQA